MAATAVSLQSRRPAPGTRRPLTVAELAAVLAAESDGLTDEVVARIHTVVNGRADGPPPRDGLWWSTKRNIHAVLQILVESRPPTAAELEVCRRQGIGNARLDVPVEDVMRAFQVAFLALWDAMTRRAQAFGPQTAALLLDRTACIWTTMHQMSTAVAEAWRAETERRDSAWQRRANAFLEGLMAYPDDSEAFTALVRSLRLDPAGPFAVAVHGPAGPVNVPGATTVRVEQPDRVVLVAQLPGPAPTVEESLVDALQRRGVHHIGVGLVRRGLEGAQRALRDAERAHRAAVALDLPSVTFRDGWLSCLSIQCEDDLRDLVGPLVDALRADGDLVQTLEGFFAADGKLTRAAEVLHLHPNTVAYRLDRLAQRTGVDPRTARGALSARLALILARSGHGPTSG